MSQVIYSSINPATTSGTQLATILNDFKEAMVSGMSGTLRPTELDAGGGWIDTSVADTLIYKLYTGSADVEIFRVNTLTNTASVPGAENSFTLTKISADTVGPILAFLKKRILSSGQVLTGDYLGNLEFKGIANDGSTQTSAKIRIIATNNYTPTTAGADIVFECTSAGSAAIAEAMRIKDGKLGIGTNAPENSLHVKGDGIRGEKVSDDAVGSRIIHRKKRIASLGQVVSGDVIGESLFKSTDEVGAEIADVAKIEVKATQNHTTTAQGTQVAMFVKKTGATALSEQLRIANDITALTNVILQKMLSLDQQLDSTTTGADQSITPTSSQYKVSHASLASINNIVPTNGKVLALINGVGASITLKNDAGGTAANRIITGTGVDLTVLSGASVLLSYDTDSSRWRVIGGSGGGTGTTTGTRQTGTSISAGTQLSPTPSQASDFFVVGNGGPVIVTHATPLATSGMAVGQKARITGTSDANTVQYDNGNNLVLTRGSAVLGKDQSVEFEYMGTDGTNAAWVETGRNF